MTSDGWRADVWCWGAWDGSSGEWQCTAARVAHILACSRWAQHAQSQGWGRLASALAQRVLRCASDAALAPTHVLVMRTLAQLQRFHVENGSDLREAFDCARAQLPVLESAYPRVWPTLGLHLAALTRLANALELDAECLGFGRRALEVLRHTHGDGAVVRSVQQALQECGMALQMAHGACC